MKREEKLFEAIGEIGDELLLESEKQQKSRRWLWIPAAACVCLAAVGSAKLLWMPAETEANPDLPMLEISTDAATMGFEGYMAYDASELVSGNPWQETDKITMLPVYRNQVSYNEYGQLTGGDFEDMRALLLDVAGRLGLDTDTLPITDDMPDEESRAKITEKFAAVGEEVPEGYFVPTKLKACQNGIEIEVGQDLTAAISFDPAVSLPDGYNFTHYASYGEVQETADYLETTYAALIGAEKPQRNIYGGDYDINGNQFYHIEFFDGSGDKVRQIINYNFNRTAFYCDDDGKLFLARVYQPDLSEKIGDYPVITAADAKELLLEGNYITTVPDEMPGEEYLAKTELVYRTGNGEEYFMPYYRFYVEVPELEQDNGLKTFGAYYVPAVSQAYITEMPVWDGSFN